MSYKKNIFIICCLGFLISAFSTAIYVNKYDKLNIYKENTIEHKMIKIAVVNHWEEANIILKQLKRGTSIFNIKNDHFDEYLPPRLLALYYYFSDHEMYDENNNIKLNNGKFFYLILKSLLYFFSLFFLFYKMSNEINQRYAFWTVCFLAFVPDLVQYHSSFWNESIFLSLQVVLLALLIKPSIEFFKNFLIGFVCCLMFLTSQEFILFFLVISFYYLICFKKFFFIPLSFFAIGFLFIILLIHTKSSQDQKNQDVSIFGIKTAMYFTLVPEMISQKENISISQAKKSLDFDTKVWIKKKKIAFHFNEDENLFTNFHQIDNKNKNLILNRIFKVSIEKITSDPAIAGKIVFRKTISTLLLNPFYVNFFHKHSGRGEHNYYDSNDRKAFVKYRILYSIFFYLTVAIGIFLSFKYLNKKLIFFLILGSIYSPITIGWLGNSRYFLPSIVFLSPFAGLAMMSFANFFYKKNSKDF